MDCVAFRAQIERDEPLGAAALAHAESCEDCAVAAADRGAVARRLLAASRAGTQADASRASLDTARRLLVRDRGALGFLRSRPTWQRVTGAVALLAAAMLGAAAAEAATGASHGLAELVPHTLVFAAGCLLLLWPLGTPLPQHARVASLCLAVALPVVFGLWAHGRALAQTAETSPWPCLAFGGALAAPFLLLLGALDRLAVLGTERALLAGSITGVAGNALLHLHCPSDGLVHLMLGHASLGVLAALVAVALGRARSTHAA